MFTNEEELKEKCKDEMKLRGIRLKYFSFLFSFAEENTYNYEDTYNRFKEIIEIVKSNDMI